MLSFCFTSMYLFGQFPANGGFENGLNDWTLTCFGGVTCTVSDVSPRTGASSLQIENTSSGLVNANSSLSTNYTANTYVHVIAWIKNTTPANGTMYLGVKNSSNTYNNRIYPTNTAYYRYTSSLSHSSNTTFGAYIMSNYSTGSTTLYVDDVVLYTSTNATPDLEKPTNANNATNITVGGSSISFDWTNGTDAGGVNTGIQNTLILRTTSLSALAPTLNDQAIYSTTGGTAGPNTIDDWTVISTTVGPSATSYTDNTIVPGTNYKYAVVHRDVACNYSYGLIVNVLFSLDTDGDGVLDNIDLDNDNDGILDCVENGHSDLASLNQIFQNNGDATQINANEVQLTSNTTLKSGQIWSFGKVDFSKSFTLSYQAYLGTNDATGADGIAAVFHNSPNEINATGANGDGIGARGIANGIVLEIDTYQNTDRGDPAADHAHIWDSDDQTSLSSPVDFPNLENGAWHNVLITWDAPSQTISYTIDGTFAGALTNDLISNYFGGVAKVYFGYTASTGASTNDQHIKITNFCANLPFELDTDDDGAPDYLDADSDNDDCEDAIEGSGAFTSSNIDGGKLTGAVDANGVPTQANGGQDIGTSKVWTQFFIDSQPEDISSIGDKIQTFSTSIIAIETSTFEFGAPNTTLPSPATDVSNTAIYQWQVNTGSGFTNISNGGVYSGATTASLTLSNTPTSMNGYKYRVIVTHPNISCLSETSEDATLTAYADADGDGVPDYSDLDNDSDGILDASEIRCDQPAYANSTSGTGAYQDKLYFFNWSGIGATLNNGDTQTFTVNDLVITATFSNVVLNGGTGAAVAPSEFKTWGQAMIADLYNTPSTQEALYGNGQLNSFSFTVNFSATKNGLPYPLDILAFDSESTSPAISNESIVFQTNGDNWVRFEGIGGGTQGDFTFAGKTVTVNNTYDGVQGNSILLSTNASTINTTVSMNYAARQGVGFGIYLRCDTDADGIPDYLELDSDADGCYDAIEGDEKVLDVNLNSGVIVGTVDANGVPNLVNSGGAADVGGDQGQGLGNAKNATLNSCNNLWVGTANTLWDNVSNWTAQEVPFGGQPIEFATTVNNTTAAANNLAVPVSTEKIIGGLTNLSDKALVIPASSGAKVQGLVTGSETNPDKIVIQAASDGVTPNGTFIADCASNSSTTIQATVQLYAKGFQGSAQTWTDNIAGSPTLGQVFTSSYKWQYFGVPVTSVAANPTFYGGFLREYKEDKNAPGRYYDKWDDLNNNSVLTAFKGYSLTQKVAKTYEIKGALQICDKEITLTRNASELTNSTATNIENKRYGLGQNVIGNSFTAAIPINQINFTNIKVNGVAQDNTSGNLVERTIYLYNTGSFGDWNGGASSLTTLTSGQFLAVPINAAGLVYNQIPSMQGFLIRHTGAIGSTINMTMPYTSLVNNEKPQTAPLKPLSSVELTLKSESTVDKLWLVQEQGTGSGFDNGWDGRKFFGTPSAFIFSPTKDGDLQVNTSDNILNANIAFISNKDVDYNLEVKTANMGDYFSELYLLDLAEKKSIPLNTPTVNYSFKAMNEGKQELRFMISNKPDAFAHSGNDDFYAYFVNNKLFAMNRTDEPAMLEVFTVAGVLVHAEKMPPLSILQRNLSLVNGVYLLNMKVGGKSSVTKIVIN